MTANPRKKENQYELHNTKITSSYHNFANNALRNKSFEDIDDLLILKRNFLKPHDSQLNVTLSRNPAEYNVAISSSKRITRPFTVERLSKTRYSNESISRVLAIRKKNQTFYNLKAGKQSRFEAERSSYIKSLIDVRSHKKRHKLNIANFRKVVQNNT